MLGTWGLGPLLGGCRMDSGQAKGVVRPCGDELMNIAFCYESVLPERGGCETYIAALAHRLVADGHKVHLYASRWDAAKLPVNLNYHAVPVPSWPRFLRPWRFGSAVLNALEGHDHDITVGFDKTWGLDIIYPQGGLFAASAHQNLLKIANPIQRKIMGFLKQFDLAHFSFTSLERRQYLGNHKGIIIAISDMVRQHFQTYYKISSSDLRMVRIAFNPERFVESDRPKRRMDWRTAWNLNPEDNVGLFCGMNYRLKGLEPLLHAVKLMPESPKFRLVVVGSPKTASFERLAKKLGITDRVRFVGYQADMRNSYFAADFFIHPTFYDPCSHVITEAMACGLPVITSKYNGASELMTPPNEGFIIDNPHDHQKLADCMIQFLDPAKRLAAGQAGRRTAQSWTFDHHYRQMVDVFREGANRRRQAA